MAAITRRTWANLRDEAIQACGGHDYTGFSSRVEYCVTEAYYDICATYHHHELESATNIAAWTIGNTSISLPADCFIVVGVRLYDTVANGSGHLGTLQYVRHHFLLSNFSTTQAQPGSFSRSKTTLYLNCPVDKAYQYVVHYYAFPTAPDFSSGSPQTAWLWDTHLIEGTLAKMQGRIWRPDLGQMNGQLLKDWLAVQPQASVQTEPQPGLPDYPTANLPQGGLQG